MATILLVEEDDDARPILRQSLRGEGHDVLLAVDEESAHGWLAVGRPAADLILINLVGRTADEALAAGRRLRGRTGRDGATPVVVIAEQYDDDLEGSDVKAGEGEWVTYMEDSRQLLGLISRLTGRDGDGRG